MHPPPYRARRVRLPHALLLSALPLALSHPYPRDDLHDMGFAFLMPRGCAEYCGADNQYCCDAGSSCYTMNGIAGCSVAAAGGGGAVAWYTTTWTETNTYTSTLSSWVPAATAGASGEKCVPEPGSGQIACGNICCASWQYCAYEGQCMANGVGGGAITSTYTSNGVVYTTQYSAPYRVTGTAAATATATGGASVGVTSGSTGSLSAGAIAGIVLGSLAGLALLITLCFCCLARGLWAALCGGGKKKKDRRRSSRDVIVEEEVRYGRGSSAHSRRDRHGSWFGTGGRPSAVAGRREKAKKKSKGLGAGAALGALLLLLGLKRDEKRRTAAKTRSDVPSTYYTDSYTTDPSSSSSRRTRDTRTTGQTRPTRHSGRSRRR